MATGLTMRRGGLGCLVSGPGLLTMLNLQLSLASCWAQAKGCGRWTGTSWTKQTFLRAPSYGGISPDWNRTCVSIGLSKPGVGPPAFPGLGGCGLFHGLPYLFLKDPPVGPSEVPGVVPGVPTITVDWWAITWAIHCGTSS